MQPAYHSSLNDGPEQVACGCAILPLKTRTKGPAPVQRDESQEDIIDETLKYFKANILFRNYEVKGAADRVLIYLTFYTHQCLLRMERKKCQKKEEGDKVLFALAQESFPAPGDRDFPLGGFFPSPKSNAEKDLWITYIKQAREELGNRLLERVFNEGGPDKYWFQFVKRKFLGKAFEN